MYVKYEHYIDPGNIATNLATHMGLLPEIERVWIAIDHNLFLWDYTDGYVRGYTTCGAMLINPKVKS